MKKEPTRLVIGDRALHLRTQGDDVVVTGIVTEQRGERAVPSEALRRDLEEKIEREQRLEMAAGRYGLSVEALLEACSTRPSTSTILRVGSPPQSGPLSWRRASGSAARRMTPPAFMVSCRDEPEPQHCVVRP